MDTLIASFMSCTGPETGNKTKQNTNFENVDKLILTSPMKNKKRTTKTNTKTTKKMNPTKKVKKTKKKGME